MKQMKKILSGTLACLAWMSLSTVETQAYADWTDKGSPNPTQIRANEAYSKVIAATGQDWDNAYSHYGLFDLEQDGIEELVLIKKGVLEIWDYINGSAQMMGSADSIGSWFGKFPGYSFSEAAMGLLGEKVCQRADGTYYIEIFSGNHGGDDSYSESHYLTYNGNQLSKQETFLIQVDKNGTWVEDVCTLDGKTVSYEALQEVRQSYQGTMVAETGVTPTGLNQCDKIRLVDIWEVRNNRNLQIYYPDVALDTWYTDAVIYNSYYVFGAMGAVEGDNFLPHANASRGAVAQTLYHYSMFFASGYQGEPDSVKNFADAVGTKYESYTHWMKGNGLMSGYSEDYFAVFHDISRQELAAILYKGHQDNQISLGKLEAVSANTSLLNQYSDASSVADWAKEAVSWCVANDIMTGFDGKISPNSPVTRAQLAVMMQKMYTGYENIAFEFGQ